MNNSIEEKRKEIFELHQSWLRPETPLMRQPVPPPIVAQKKIAPIKQKVVEQKEEKENELSPKTSWVVKAVVGVTAVLVLLELLFFASELGWFK